MAYNTKPIITDKDGNPISQYYNPDTDSYEPVEGSHGANKVLVENNDLSLIPILDKLSQLTGTVIDEETRKSNELERIDNEDTRQSNELQRIQNENTRVQNENIRKINEQNRIDLYNDLMEKVSTGYFDGKNLEFHWDGTKLGVRVEGETEYIYVDLKGEKGDTGPKGPKGDPGNVDSVNGKTGEVVIDVGDIAGLVGTRLALGRDASATGDGSVALGRNASTTGIFSVAIGTNAAAGTYAVALGHNTSAGSFSVALGYNASVARSSSVAIGEDASVAENYSVTLGYRASAENANEGVLGGTGAYRTSKWIVPGSFTVSGTKNFEIPHPKPEKSATHVIRHGAVESPTPGDTLYRWKIQATKENDLVTIDLPDYFIYLNKDVQIFVTPQGHFGNGYGELNRETEQLQIHCQFAGEYNVLVIGTRNDDHQSVQDWDIKGVEREVGESWTGETYAFSVDEIMEVEEIKEVI